MIHVYIYTPSLLHRYGRVPGGLQAKCNKATHVCAFNPDCTVQILKIQSSMGFV
jgi:hypothetical protein